MKPHTFDFKLSPFSCYTCILSITLLISSFAYLFYFIGSDEVLLKIILESLIHINALNRMEKIYFPDLTEYCYSKIILFALLILFTLNSLPGIFKYSKFE